MTALVLLVVFMTFKKASNELAPLPAPAVQGSSYSIDKQVESRSYADGVDVGWDAYKHGMNKAETWALRSLAKSRFPSSENDQRNFRVGYLVGFREDGWRHAKATDKNRTKNEEAATSQPFANENIETKQSPVNNDDSIRLLALKTHKDDIIFAERSGLLSKSMAMFVINSEVIPKEYYDVVEKYESFSISKEDAEKMISDVSKKIRTDMLKK